MARESPLMKFMYYNYPDVKYYPSLHLQARSGLRWPIPSFPGLCFSFLASAAPESLAAWGSLDLGSFIFFFDPMGITSVVFVNKELRGRLRSISWYPVPIPNLDLLFCLLSWGLREVRSVPLRVCKSPLSETVTELCEETFQVKSSWAQVQISLSRWKFQSCNWLPRNHTEA